MIFAYFIASFLSGMLIFAVASYTWRRRRVNSQDPSQSDDTMVGKVGALVQWGNSFSHDVSSIRGELEEIAKECNVDLQQAPTPQGLTHILTQLCSANDRLKSRVDAAESQLKEQQEELQEYMKQVRTDGLTGLPNRRTFDEEFARRMAEWRRYKLPFSMALLDVDHFKAINDNYGHLAGDHVLRQVAVALRGGMREVDLVTRYGGEEFAVIMPATTGAPAHRAADRARQAIERAEIEFDGRSIRVTASCGAAEALESDDVNSLLKRADDALYVSKRAGRNVSHWHDGGANWRITLQGLADSPSNESQRHESQGGELSANNEHSLNGVKPSNAGPDLRCDHSAHAQAATGEGSLNQICQNLRQKLREAMRS